MGVLGIVPPAQSQGGTNVGGGISAYDVKRKYQWYLSIDTTQIPKLGAIANAQKSLIIQCKKASRPEITFGEHEIKWGNEAWRIAGRQEFNKDIEVEFYDAHPQSAAVGGSRNANIESVSNVMYSWYTGIYDPNTGRMNYANQYKTTAALFLTTPGGQRAEGWFFVGWWPKAVNFQDVDYDSDEALTISVTFAYDKVYRIKQEELGAAGEGLTYPSDPYVAAPEAGAGQTGGGTNDND